MLFKRLRSILLPLAVSLPLSALAGPFSSLVVFGDSLSDTGNLATANVVANSLPVPTLPPIGTGFNGPYYQNSRLSNGPVWLESLAAGLGLASEAAPALLGGNNYAFAGARTGVIGSPPGVLAQAVGLWGQAAAEAAIDNLANTIGYLASKGAKNILISTLPNLGASPEATFLNVQAASADASERFNALIQSALMSAGAALGLHMYLLDMAGLFDSILANPLSFGISNTSLPCVGFEFSGGASCDASLFADVLHPSAYAHSLIARAALAVLGVPEPGTLVLFGLALLVLVVARRRRSV